MVREDFFAGGKPSQSVDMRRDCASQIMIGRPTPLLKYYKAYLHTFLCSLANQRSPANCKRGGCWPIRLHVARMTCRRHLVLSARRTHASTQKVCHVTCWRFPNRTCSVNSRRRYGRLAAGSSPRLPLAARAALLILRQETSPILAVVLALQSKALPWSRKKKFCSGSGLLLCSSKGRTLHGVQKISDRMTDEIVGLSTNG